MKKIITLILVLVFMGTSLVGCGEENSVNETLTDNGIKNSTENEITETMDEDTISTSEDIEDEKTVLETVEITGKSVTGTETRYSDGTSDYEIYFTDTDINKTIHYRITSLDTELLTFKNVRFHIR